MTFPPWWRARSLAERFADARAAAAARPSEAPLRRGRWEEVLPDAGVLAERLRAAGGDLADLDAALAEEPPPTGAREPDWWRWVAETLAPGSRSPVRDASDDGDADVLRGSLRLVAPFARRVRARLAEHPAARADVVRLLTHNVAFELAELCRPSVAMELAATRAAESWQADEAVARSARLLRSLGRPERALALLGEHPALARLLACRARLATEAGGELLERLEADLPAVTAELLGGRPAGRIERLHPAGDAHDGGRRVVGIGFASGARVALKPRSLLGDLAFQRLLAELTARGFRPGFRELPTLVAGPHHGWQAWVEPAGCGSKAAVARYYRRLGGQLAALYALRAVDLHQENVIACGEHPVLVDLEGMLHPRLGGARAAIVDPEIAETGAGCVLRVGLLPRADVAFGVDIGGLGRDPLGRVEVQELAWVGEAADARLERRSVELGAGPNAPRLRGEPVRPHEYVDDLAAGFTDAYRLLVAHRDELLAPGGALEAFAAAPIRFILRPTRVYVDLLRRQASDGAALDDGLAREEALNVLWRGAVRRPDLRLAAAAERHDLWQGDVPKITGTPGRADAHHHALGTLKGLLGPHPAPTPEIVRRLDAKDLERQVALLRTAVLAAAAPAGSETAAQAACGTAAAAAGGKAAAQAASGAAAALSGRETAAQAASGAAAAPAGRETAAQAASGAAPALAGGETAAQAASGVTRPPVAPGAKEAAARGSRSRAPSRAELLEAVLAAARRLDALALLDGDHAGWLTPVAAPGHPGRVLRAAGPDVAGGQAGIALFLALASAATGDEPIAGLARRAACRLVAQLDGAPPGEEPEAQRQLHALARIGRALGDEALVARSRDRLGQAETAAPGAGAAATPRRDPAAVDHDRGAPGCDPAAPLDRRLLGEVAENVDAARRGDWASLTGGIEVPGLRGGIAGHGLTWIALLDQIDAEAAAAALACSAP